MTLLKVTLFITTLILIVSFAIVFSINRYFLIFEYSRPNFPLDQYGMSANIRFQLASESLSYLSHWKSPQKVLYLLSDLKFPQTQQWAYTPQEVDHLKDVKHYTDTTRLLFILSLTVFFTLLFNSYSKPKYFHSCLKAIRSASIFLILTISVIGVLAIFAWQQFFIQFHQLLFPQGNWTFSVSSTLIRLFPQMFWIDYATLIISIILITCLVIIVSSTYLLHRRKKFQKN